MPHLPAVLEIQDSIGGESFDINFNRYQLFMRSCCCVNIQHSKLPQASKFCAHPTLHNLLQPTPAPGNLRRTPYPAGWIIVPEDYMQVNEVTGMQILDSTDWNELFFSKKG